MSQPAPTDVTVGPLQFECLSVLWERGPSTIQTILGKVNEKHEHRKVRPVAYTTILTVCRNLARRNVCARVEDARAHTYRAVRTRAEFHAEMAQQFLDAYFDGDLQNMTDALGVKPRSRSAKAKP